MKLKKNSEYLEGGTTWNMKLKKKRNTKMGKYKPRWGQRERDEEEGKS